MRANASYRDIRQWIDQASPRPRGRRQTFGDAEIATVFLWAKHHGQPTYWASDPAVYPPACKFVPPSASTVSRRLRRVPVIELISRVRRRHADQAQMLPLKLMDARPLPVGNSSQDRDARRGYGGGGPCRGYKVCALVSNQIVREWTMSSMNQGDQIVGVKLLESLPLAAPDGWGYVVADNGFDGNPLHIKADEKGHVLVAPPRKANRGVRDPRRNSPQRIRSLDLTDSPLRHAGVYQTMGSKLMRDRGGIERTFSHGTFMGLGALPPWVRTPHRVALHIEAMLIFATYRMLQVKAKTQQRERRASPCLPSQTCELAPVIPTQVSSG